jgi:glycosyltransferase involved in cell wall biosynthesis
VPEPDAIGIVVPANNEEELLPACLASVLASADAVACPVDIVVVLDDCRDTSAAVAERFACLSTSRVSVRALTAHYRNVGAARALGVGALMRRGAADGLWIATTDADTTVSPDWLSRQLRHAGCGASVVVGTIRVADWADRTDALAERAEAAYVRSEHRHVHGANLSFAAPAYVRAGGFTPLSADEDLALVREFVAAQESIVWATDLPVLTSGRRVGRTTSGFAGYLNDLEQTMEQEPA